MPTNDTGRDLRKIEQLPADSQSFFLLRALPPLPGLLLRLILLNMDLEPLY